MRWVNKTWKTTTEINNGVKKSRLTLIQEPLAALRNRYDPGLAVGHKIIRFVGRRIHSLKNSLQQQRGKEEEPLLKPAASSGRTPGNDEFDDQVKEALHTSRKPMSYRDVLTYQSILNLFTYTILATHSVGFDQLIPVYLHQEQQDPSDPDVSPPFYFKGGFQICGSSFALTITSTLEFMRCPALTHCKM